MIESKVAVTPCAVSVCRRAINIGPIKCDLGDTGIIIIGDVVVNWLYIVCQAYKDLVIIVFTYDLH